MLFRNLSWDIDAAAANIRRSSTLECGRTRMTVRLLEPQAITCLLLHRMTAATAMIGRKHRTLQRMIDEYLIAEDTVTMAATECPH